MSLLRQAARFVELRQLSASGHHKQQDYSISQPILRQRINFMIMFRVLFTKRDRGWYGNKISQMPSVKFNIYFGFDNKLILTTIIYNVCVGCCAGCARSLSLPLSL